MRQLEKNISFYEWVKDVVGKERRRHINYISKSELEQPMLEEGRRRHIIYISNGGALLDPFDRGTTGKKSV